MFAQQRHLCRHLHCFVVALMVSAATILVPSASTHCFPDIDLTTLFVRAFASLVVALMLLTALLLFVFFFLPTLQALLALPRRLHPLPPMFCS
jgi:hypothetical protein